jgi:2-hydroxy-6-oxonona-2,4-dienedioate hydrolase
VEEMKENKVILNDFKIRYLKSEKRNSSKMKNILFIHGLGSSSDRWLDIPDALSRYFHPVVAVDLIGFGGSDKPVSVDYTIEYLANLLETSLIVSKFGGMIIMAMMMMMRIAPRQ